VDGRHGGAGGVTPEEFLGESSTGRAVFAALEELLAGLPDVEVRTTRSQIAFRRRRGFAYLWLPGMYLRQPRTEVVLSIATDREIRSPRFAEVVHPAPGTWQHHLDVRDTRDLDDEVARWLREAYERAG
jgi:hypothetical protein